MNKHCFPEGLSEQTEINNNKERSATLLRFFSIYLIHRAYTHLHFHFQWKVQFTGNNKQRNEEFIGNTKQRDEEFIGNTKQRDEEFIGNTKQKDVQFTGNTKQRNEGIYRKHQTKKYRGK